VCVYVCMCVCAPTDTNIDINTPILADRIASYNSKWTLPRLTALNRFDGYEIDHFLESQKRVNSKIVKDESYYYTNNELGFEYDGGYIREHSIAGFRMDGINSVLDALRKVSIEHQEAIYVLTTTEAQWDNVKSKFKKLESLNILAANSVRLKKENKYPFATRLWGLFPSCDRPSRTCRIGVVPRRVSMPDVHREALVLTQSDQPKKICAFAISICAEREQGGRFLPAHLRIREHPHRRDQPAASLRGEAIHQ